MRIEKSINIIKALLPQANLIEVGSGSGSFLDAANRNHLMTEGIEMNQEASRLANARGLNCSQCRIGGDYL